MRKRNTSPQFIGFHSLHATLNCRVSTVSSLVLRGSRAVDCTDVAGETFVAGRARRLCAGDKASRGPSPSAGRASPLCPFGARPRPPARVSPRTPPPAVNIGDRPPHFIIAINSPRINFLHRKDHGKSFIVREVQSTFPLARNFSKLQQKFSS